MSHTTRARPGPDPADADVAATRDRLARLARLLDRAVHVPGTGIRFGLDAGLNLIPGLGTLVAQGLSAYLILEAARIGVPRGTLARMLANLGVDTVISAIPVVGWVGDVFFRANTRNMDLLRRHLDARSDAAHGPTIDGTAARVY